MTEEELKEVQRGIPKLELSHAEAHQAASLADIAHQLTRIADSLKLSELTDRLERVTKVANDLNEPAADALVEAVKLIARGNATDYLKIAGRVDLVKQWEDNTISYERILQRALEIALAAHKKTEVGHEREGI